MSNGIEHDLRFRGRSVSEVGALFATYFAIETLGYVQGLGSRRKSTDAWQPLRDGMDHLIHFFTPWDKVAWPASPVFCAALLGYAPFLPKFMVMAAPAPWGACLNRAAICLAIVVSLTTASVAILGPERSAGIIHHNGPKHRAVLSLVYVAWLCILIGVALWCVPDIVLPAELRNDPWPQFLGTIFTGRILFLTYLGSRFDGALDRLEGTDRKPSWPAIRAYAIALWTRATSRMDDGQAGSS